MLKYLIVLDMLVWFTVYLFISMLSIYILEYAIGGNILLAGTSISVFFLTRAAGDFLFPRLFKTRTNTIQLLLALSMLPLAFVFLMFIKDVKLSFIPVFLLGLSMGLYNPAKLSLFSKFNKKSNERSWGSLDGAGLVAVSLSSLVSGLILRNNGFLYLFIFGIGCSVVLLLISLRLLKIRRM